MNVYELIIESDREEHIGRHNVNVYEVEEVVFGKHVSFRARFGYFGLIGQTEVGRYLTILIAPREPGVFGLVTARDADDSERRLYRKRAG